MISASRRPGWTGGVYLCGNAWRGREQGSVHGRMQMGDGVSMGGCHDGVGEGGLSMG